MHHFGKKSLFRIFKLNSKFTVCLSGRLLVQVPYKSYSSTFDTGLLWFSRVISDIYVCIYTGIYPMSTFHSVFYHLVAKYLVISLKIYSYTKKITNKFKILTSSLKLMNFFFKSQIIIFEL